MNYKHLNQFERYLIHSLMYAQHNITQIVRLLGGDKSTISRELCNAGCRGYKAKQACDLACNRSESSRTANALTPGVKEQTSALRRLKWCPEQIAGKLPVSHESLYLHVYAIKAGGGTLWKNLRCQMQLSPTFCQLGVKLQSKRQWPAAAIRAQEAPDGKNNGRGN